MKLICPAILLVSLLGSPTVDAAECTQAQLASFSAMGSNADFAKDCASVLGATPSTTAIDASTLAGLNPCGDAKCVAFLKKFASTLPACEIAGYSLKSSFDMAISLCSSAPGTLPSMMPTGMPTSMPTDMPTEGSSTNSTESDTASSTDTGNSTDSTNTTMTTTRPPSSGASPVKEADTPAPSKTSSAIKATPSVFIVATTFFAAGSWLLVA